MRLSIRSRLTLTLVVFTACLLTATLLLARWSFLSGFYDFINGIEESRLLQVAARLATLYEAEGGWPPDIERRFPRVSREPFTHARQRPPPMPPPPHERRRPRGPRRSGPHPTGLYDAGGVRIAGADLDTLDVDRVTMPVIVQGQRVGYVQSAPRTGVSQPLQAAFAARHLESMIVVGLVALVIVILLSVLLSRLMLAALQRLLDGISRLSSGDYDVEFGSTRTDELGVLMRDFDRLAATLRESRRARRRMFADISHELRTPLAVLGAEIEALRDGIRAPTDEALASLEDEVDRLTYLVGDLYDLSISDAGALAYSFARHDISTLVRQVIDTLPGDPRAGIELTARLASAWADVDPRRFVQLVRNVLINALAYTDRPGRITVELSATAEGVVLTVCDSAPSVPLEDCERLFEPMYRREPSRSRQTAGAGLGLAICRSIADAHRGTITAAPDPLGGLRITTTLPSR